jgi:glycosyltransferase involved in cell wall biosynthesis
MRILHTANTYPPLKDGVAEVVRHISERLVKQGHHVTVATSSCASRKAYALINGVHVYSFSVQGNQAVGMNGQVRSYQDFIRNGKWDIMVNHCVQTWPTDAILTEVNQLPWPSLLVTHGFSALHNQIYESYFSNLPQYISQYSGWACISSLTEEIPFAHQHSLALPKVMANGVDLQEWSQSQHNLRCSWGIGHSPWIVNLSNHSPLKGHHLFFELAERLRDTDFHFTLIGNHYPMSKWGLGRFGVKGGCFYRCLARSVFSPGKIDLKSNLDRRYIVSALQEADIFVSTSQREANSVVILESMAAETPWVSFNVGSVKAHVGGFIVRDMDELVEKVRRLISQSELRIELGKQGKQRIQECHSWDQIVLDYEQLYQKLIT